MSKRIRRMMKITSLILALAFASQACTTAQRERLDDDLEQTVVAIAIQELESTPSPMPPTPTIVLPPTPTATPTAPPTEAPTPTASYPAEGYGPTDFPPNVNPLTGLYVDDASRLNRRPISVKISNYPRGIRPQWGLSLADHVFEYYHEGGLTRFHAIFYSQDAEQIGPIRSARFSDKDLVEMYKSFFAYASGDYRVRARLSYSDFTDRMATITDVPCPSTPDFPLCRIEQGTWNHLVGSTSMLYQHFEEKGVSNERQNLDGLFFNTTLPPDGQPASTVLVRYSFGSQHQWVYDPISGKYARHEDVVDADQGEEVFQPMVDRLTGQPITADNVVVLLTKHEYFRVQPEMIEIPFEGFGKAYVFREGHAYLVNWGRVVDDAIIFLTYDNGEPFPLKPGNTWFVVLGATSEVRTASPDWRFQFFIP